jgi:hypothetical protein
MVGKTLLNLDEIGHTSRRDFDPNAAIRRHAAEITEHQMAARPIARRARQRRGRPQEIRAEPAGRANRILDRLADNEFRSRSTPSTRPA